MVLSRMKSERGRSELIVEKWLSLQQISDHLGVSKENVYRWLECNNDNGMPCHKMGKLWKFKVSEIDTWMCSGKVKKPISRKAVKPKVKETIKPVAKIKKVVKKK